MMKAEDLSKQVYTEQDELVILRAGKTTLLGLLAGLDTPSQGGVIVGGVDLNQDKNTILLIVTHDLQLIGQALSY